MAKMKRPAGGLLRRCHGLSLMRVSSDLLRGIRSMQLYLLHWALCRFLGCNRTARRGDSHLESSAPKPSLSVFWAA